MEPASCTVLIVEDDEPIRALLCELLGEEGMRTVTAANGREGLAHLRELDHPCVVVLDLAMPEMDGRKLVELMRGDPRTASVPVVVLSAARLAPDFPPVAAYLRKPASLDDMIDAIRTHCR